MTPFGAGSLLRSLLAVALLSALPSAAHSPSALPSSDSLSRLVSVLSERIQGPFKGIYWYCPDGRVLHAKDEEKCNDDDAIQHGALRDDLAVLSRKGLWLGQLLAGQPSSAMLDSANGHRRILQYLMEQWLVQSQDGWIFRKARTYRGAVQPEDEQKWADSILVRAVSSPMVREHYYMVRLLADRLPESVADKGLRERIRWTSRAISDSVPRFFAIRAKIHGVPGPEDLDSVLAFQKRSGRFHSSVDTLFRILENDLRREYLGIPAERRARLYKDKQLLQFPEIRVALDSSAAPDARIAALSSLLVELRSYTEGKAPVARRVRALRRSLELEQVLLEVASAHRPHTIEDALSQGRSFAHAMVGTGLLEPWEEDRLFSSGTLLSDNIPLDTLQQRIRTLRAATEWGLGTMRGTLGPTVDLFAAFEPEASGFLDDLARQSLLLELGSIVDRMQAYTMKRTRQQANGNVLVGGRGLQSGIAMGKLRIVESSSAPMPAANEIAVLAAPPASLKPVAGILSFSEGNPVSHVQLLARNLGIASAVIPTSALDTLRRLAGHTVFLAVSPGGMVLLKDSTSLDSVESALVRRWSWQAPRERIAVDINRLQLDRTDMPLLDSLRVSHSGVLCGPKAANLGQLASQFPGRVPRGFVLPFGMFRAHLQQVSSNGHTYWDNLAMVYATEAKNRASGMDSAKADSITLASLARFRESLMQMPFRPGFVDSLRVRYRQVFGADASKVGVFVRSDTNMEDLKDFTGAGLNKTIPNVVGEKELHRAIHEVWASAFSERSYLWRQRFLKNPLDIYASVLLLESVNADASGVLLTSTLGEGHEGEFLLSVNRGVGGAVDGQAAESWFLEPGGGTRLRMPAREPSADRLPLSGGMRNEPISWDRPILDSASLASFRSMGEQVRTVMLSVGMPSPYDSEMAIRNGKIMLLQVRPLKSGKGGPARDWLARLDHKDTIRTSVVLKEALP